jgi:toxin ParE1/3/4
MARVQKREAAKRDLIAQWVWYAENASVEVADRFLEAADQTLNLLSTQPESGSVFLIRRLELQGIRRFPVSGGFEKILLFYFPLEDGIDLVRVIHGSRDLLRMFAEGFLSYGGSTFEGLPRLGLGYTVRERRNCS